MPDIEKRKLTPKERLFIQEYIVDWNASAAYRRCGYKSKNSDVNGPRLLGKDGIPEAIAEAMADREKRTNITADKILTDLEAVKDDAMRLVGDEGFMIDRPSAIRALELQGKNQKMWTDKLDVGVRGQINLIGEFRIELVNP